MSFAKIDVENGTLKNIGTLVNTAYDGLVYGTGAYDAVDKCFKCGATGGIKTSAGSSFTSGTSVRIVFTTGYGTIFACAGASTSYCGLNIMPVAGYGIFIGSYPALYIPNDGLIVCDGKTINDLTISRSGNDLTILNNVTKQSYTVNNQYFGFISNWLTFGYYFDNYAGNYNASMKIYSITIGTVADEITNTKYLLKKDDLYYAMDDALVDPVLLGADIAAAIPLASDYVVEAFYSLLNTYKLITISTARHQTGIMYDDLNNPKVFKKDAADILTGDGIPLNDYTSSINEDVVIRVPKDINLLVDDSIMYESKNIAATMGNRSLTHTTDTVGLKNYNMTSSNVIDTINVSKPVASSIELDALYIAGRVSTTYKKPQYYYSEFGSIYAIDTDDGIDKIIANDIDSPVALVMSYECNGEMFPDEFSIDAGSGLSDILVNIKTYLSIKLPKEYISIKTKPDWMSVDVGYLKGIPQKHGVFKLEIELSDNIIDANIIVSAVKRLK